MATHPIWTGDQVANLGKSGVSVGYYDTEEAAAKAYDRAAIGLLGRDNCSITTNFPLTAYDEDLVSSACSRLLVRGCLVIPVGITLCQKGRDVMWTAIHIGLNLSPPRQVSIRLSWIAGKFCGAEDDLKLIELVAGNKISAGLQTFRKGFPVDFNLQT